MAIPDLNNNCSVSKPIFAPIGAAYPNTPKGDETINKTKYHVHLVSSSAAQGQHIIVVDGDDYECFPGGGLDIKLAGKLQASFAPGAWAVITPANDGDAGIGGEQIISLLANALHTSEREVRMNLRDPALRQLIEHRLMKLGERRLDQPYPRGPAESANA